MLALPASPSQESPRPVEYVNEAYTDVMTEVDAKLPPNHDIIYIPFAPEQRIDTLQNMTYSSDSDLPGIMAEADMVICISRDEDLNPSYSDQDPEHNTILTPSGASNVDKSVELFKTAQAEGNDNIKFISTGRMHNRAVRMMLALPVIAEFIGINQEDAYHLSESRFKELLDAAFTPEHIGELDLDTEDEELAAHNKAVVTLLSDEEYGASVPTKKSSPEELQKAADAIWQEYQKYPRISTSRNMVERAVQAGVPLESIFEENGAVDTISNILNTAKMLEPGGALEGDDIRRVVIVAGSDQLPRTTWIADHILPDGIEIVCVESNPALDADAYAQSCERERNSFRKGSKWIEGTRDLEELESIVEKGYFGVERTDAKALAAQVAAHAVKNSVDK